jgi:hypothetical protein
MLFALESHIGRKAPQNAAICLIRDAAIMLDFYALGRNGVEQYRRRGYKEFEAPLPEFGEGLWI